MSENARHYGHNRALVGLVDLRSLAISQTAKQKHKHSVNDIDVRYWIEIIPPEKTTVSLPSLEHPVALRAANWD